MLFSFQLDMLAHGQYTTTVVSIASGGAGEELQFFSICMGDGSDMEWR